MAINPIDISFLVVIAYGVFQGLKKGFISTILSIAKVVIILFVALRFNFILSRVLNQVFNMPEAFTPLLSFLILLGGVSLFFYVLDTSLNQFAKVSILSNINRWLGITIWVSAIIMGYSTFISMSDTSGLLAQWVKDTSYVYPYIEPFADIVSCKFEDIIPSIKKILESLLIILESIVGALIGACGLR